MSVCVGQKYTLTITVMEDGEPLNISTTTARKVGFVNSQTVIKDAVLVDGGVNGVMRATVEGSENVEAGDMRAQGKIWWPDGSHTPTSVYGYTIKENIW